MRKLLVPMLVLAGMVAPAGAHANVSFDTDIGSNSQVTVGDSDVDSVFRISNNTDAGTATLMSAKLTPACQGFGFPCTNEEGTTSLFDSGVMTLGPTATGRDGDGCEETTFTIGAADANGAHTLTPVGSPPVLAATDGGFGGADTCRIDYTVDVLKLPTVDADDGEPGIQTYSAAEITVDPGGAITDSNAVTVAPKPVDPGPGGGGGGTVTPGPTGQRTAALKKCAKKKSKKAKKKCRKRAKKLPL
jgi:hypothetical protein